MAARRNSFFPFYSSLVILFGLLVQLPDSYGNPHFIQKHFFVPSIWLLVGVVGGAILARLNRFQPLTKRVVVLFQVLLPLLLVVSLVLTVAN